MKLNQEFKREVYPSEEGKELNEEENWEIPAILKEFY